MLSVSHPEILSPSRSTGKFPNAVIAPAFVLLPEIPRTSVGKFKKITLREQFANWTWDQ
jgi:acyl-CoA synthetase (AMP-forming)/AMP-acid ligase II